MYCVRIGLSVPSVWFSWSTAVCEANGPSTRRATLPGSTFAMKKTRMLSSTRVTSPRATRLAMNLAMVRTRPAALGAGGEPGLGDVVVAHRGHLHVADVLLRPGEEVVEVGVDVRGLVEQQRLDLLRRRLLRLQVERLDVVLHEPVVGRVLEVRRVPHALARELRVEEQVRHAAVA